MGGVCKKVGLTSPLQGWWVTLARERSHVSTDAPHNKETGQVQLPHKTPKTRTRTDTSLSERATPHELCTQVFYRSTGYLSVPPSCAHSIGANELALVTVNRTRPGQSDDTYLETIRVKKAREFEPLPFLYVQK